MLPLGGVSLTALLAGCNSSDDDDDSTPPVAPVTFKSASFRSMAAPSLSQPELMARTTVASALELTFSDGSKRSVELGYEPFFMTGDAVPDGKGGTVVAGGYYNLAGAPIVDNSVPAKARQFFSNCPDGMSLLSLSEPTKVAGVAGNALYAVVQFEYQSMDQAGKDMYGLLPSQIAVLTLSQDTNTGKLSLVKYHTVDTSSVHGLWITCGASLSPWNTHLSSEEYEPDATTAKRRPRSRPTARISTAIRPRPIPTTTATCPRSPSTRTAPALSRSTIAWAAFRTSWCRSCRTSAPR